MKSKISLCAYAIALSLVAIPFAAKAQTHTHAPLLLAQEQKGPMHNGPMERLGLTDAQKSQIQEIHRKTRAEMEKVFTPEQLQTLKAARQNRQNGDNRRNVMSSLNLTQNQKDQLRQIRESEKTQIDGILTPEQRQQMQQFRDNMRARYQQRNSNPTPNP